jgi:hypothetical protein
MKLGRLLVLFSLFAFVGEVAYATIHTFGPPPRCNINPNDPRCRNN